MSYSLFPACFFAVVPASGTCEIECIVAEPIPIFSESFSCGETLGVFKAQRLLLNGQGPLVGGLGLLILALLLVELGQVREGLGHIGMALSQTLFAERKRATAARLLDGGIPSMAKAQREEP